MIVDDVRGGNPRHVFRESGALLPYTNGLDRHLRQHPGRDCHLNSTNRREESLSMNRSNSLGQMLLQLNPSTRYYVNVVHNGRKDTPPNYHSRSSFLKPSVLTFPKILNKNLASRSNIPHLLPQFLRHTVNNG
jgi:hypothetical protein